MDIVLLILYLGLLAAGIVLLISAIRHPRALKWVILCLAEAASSVAAYAIARYYESLPGSGFMPGLTYFAEAILSYGAAFTFAAMLGISLLACILRALIGKKTH